MSRFNNAKKLLSGIVLVARQPTQLSILKRITNHISSKRTVQVTSLDEADTEIARDQPDAIIIDVSDYNSGEFKARLEPFLLRLPGWIRTFFVDNTPTKSRVVRAANLGVDGVLKAPISHHGISTLLNECGIATAAQSKREPSKDGKN